MLDPDDHMRGPDDPRHGTEGGYTNQRCRCPDCTAANTAAVLNRKARREPLPPDDPRHGTPNGYTNHGCHCDHCRAAAATAAREQYARRKARDT